jgi:hypothetical protein
MKDYKLGFYQVGWKTFVNKSLALIESKKTGYEFNWLFNDTVYSKFDWTILIETSLTELYRIRAQQLRDQYDHLVLYYSGGVDSNNILHAFIDNNILLDEIVMQLPELDRKNFNNYDTSSRNAYGEIDAVAIPYLNHIKNKINPKTKIRTQDFSKPVVELLSQDDWFETNPFGTNFNIAGLGRQASQLKENHIIDICYSGKTACQILGVDKPLVYFDGTDYYAYFSDLSAMHAPPVDLNYQEIFYNRYQTEFFYWTPDLPEIVIKQAQEIKKICEVNPIAKDVWAQSLKMHVGEYRQMMSPIIYPNVYQPQFQTEKPSTDIVRPMDQWFWDTASDKAKNNYLETLNYLSHKIDNTYLRDGNIAKGFLATNSKFYKL